MYKIKIKIRPWRQLWFSVPTCPVIHHIKIISTWPQNFKKVAFSSFSGRIIHKLPSASRATHGSRSLFDNVTCDRWRCTNLKRGNFCFSIYLFIISIDSSVEGCCWKFFPALLLPGCNPWSCSSILDQACFCQGSDRCPLEYVFLHFVAFEVAAPLDVFRSGFTLLRQPSRLLCHDFHPLSTVLKGLLNNNNCAVQYDKFL